MEHILENLMLIAFLAAMCHLLYRLARNTIANLTLARLFTITMGIGFLLGAASKISSLPLEGTFYLYVLGALLSYTTFLFTLPVSRKDH